MARGHITAAITWYVTPSVAPVVTLKLYCRVLKAEVKHYISQGKALFKQQAILQTIEWCSYLLNDECPPTGESTLFS